MGIPSSGPRDSARLTGKALKERSLFPPRSLKRGRKPKTAITTTNPEEGEMTATGGDDSSTGQVLCRRKFRRICGPKKGSSEKGGYTRGRTESERRSPHCQSFPRRFTIKENRPLFRGTCKGERCAVSTMGKRKLIEGEEWRPFKVQWSSEKTKKTRRVLTTLE